ncbi:MAG: hypothetical protein QNI99_17385 [Woeseiaceae bacterium]|nr:hypothetical protein [Woeseiaceae bacterium]
MDLLLLIAGLAGLWFGTEITIRGAVSISSRLGISEFVVGVAVLSVGSDLPELAIAIDGAIKNIVGEGASDVVVGTALGSYLGQLGLVLGCAALILNLTLPKGIALRHGGALIGSLVLLGIFGADGIVTRLEGVGLTIAYVIYLVALFTDPASHDAEDLSPHHDKLLKTLVLLFGGLAIVTLSAEMTVSGAIGFAEDLGVSEAFVSFVIIGLGTSLPELSISVGAAIAKRASLSIGNLIGSNVFDTLVPIGVAAAISRISFDRGMLTTELPYLILLTVVVMFFFLYKRGIQRIEAFIILGMYFGYVTFKAVMSQV